MKTSWKWLLITCASLLFAAVAMGDEPQKFDPTDQQILLHAEAQRHRVANGRDAQELDAELCRICQSHAERMAASRSMFHGGQDNVVCWGASTPVSAIGMWCNSAPHNAWLLSSTRRAGWGAAQSSGGTWYWAGAFRGATTTTSNTSHGISRRWFRWRR